jgi:hypothetical protein
MTNIRKLAGTVRKTARDVLLESNNATLKYKAVQKATHVVFFPGYLSDGELVDSYSVNLHRWGTGRRTEQCICLDGITTADGEYTGTCPICERIDDSWEIYNLLKARAEVECTLVGEARDKALKTASSELIKSRTAQNAEPRTYLPIVRFLTNEDPKTGRVTPQLGADGLPEFEIKIASYTKFSIEKFTKKLEEAELYDDDGNLVPLHGQEFRISYPDNSQAMVLVGQMSVTRLDDSKQYITKYPGVLDKINAEIAEFDFEAALDRTFPELKDVKPQTLTTKMNQAFLNFDTYKEELAVNPNAEYRQYGLAVNTAVGAAAPVADEVDYDVAADTDDDDEVVVPTAVAKTARAGAPRAAVQAQKLDDLLDDDD